MSEAQAAVGRFPGIAVATMSPAQHAAYRALTEGVRGSVPKPYEIWLCNPALVTALERLGLHVTRGSTLTPREIEIAVLLAARNWRAEFVSYAHSRIGKRVGLPDGMIAALREGRTPSFDDAREQAVHAAAAALLRGGPLDAEAYAAAKRHLGDAELTDLSILLGYYAGVAFTLNTYDVRAPADETA